MGAYTYTVKKVVGLGTTPIENVQDISWSVGRKLITDQVASGRFMVSGRRPDLLPAIAIGDVIEVAYGPAFEFVNFKVADFQIDYGFTASADTWVITGEDAFAELGRVNATVNLAGTTGNSLQALRIATGVRIETQFGGTDIYAQTLTNANGLTVAAQLFNGEQPGFYYATATDILWDVRQPIYGYDTFYATDETPGPLEWKYDSLEFNGLADNYATKVNIISDGVGTVTAGTGNRTYEMTTYNDDTDYMENVAGLYAGYLSGSTIAPSSVSLIAENQTSTKKIISFVQWSFTRADLFNIKFRGTTYYTMVLGITVTATPELTRVTYNLAPSTVLASFILDSESRGILGGTGIIYNTPMDYNELGYIYNDDYADNGNRLGF